MEYTREIGDGTFSVGSAVKGGAISCKVSTMNEEDSKKAIITAIKLQRFAESKVDAAKNGVNI